MTTSATRWTGLAVLAVVLCAALLWTQRSPHAASPLAPEELLATAPDRAPLVVDVRSRGEFAAGHVPHAWNVPIDELPSRVEEVRSRAGSREVVVYCQSGGRASRAAELLQAQGVPGIRHLTGDYGAWSAAGRPVERGDAAP